MIKPLTLLKYTFVSIFYTKENGYLLKFEKKTLFINKGKVHPCTGTEALYRPYGP